MNCELGDGRILQSHDAPPLPAVEYERMDLRVLVVDDHRMFADALAAMLRAVDGVTVVGTATEAARAIELARSLRPDIVTLDVNLGDADGIEIARQLQGLSPAPKIVVVTCVDDVDRILQAIWAGVQAWVPKDTSTTSLVDVVRCVARGDAWLPPQLLGTVLQAIVGSSGGCPPDRTPLASLTPRERQVLRCMLAGLDRAATAELLGLSLNTVRTHAQGVLTKLHVHSALEAVSLALSSGMRPDAVSESSGWVGLTELARHEGRAPARALHPPMPRSALPSRRQPLRSA